MAKLSELENKLEAAVFVLEDAARQLAKAKEEILNASGDTDLSPGATAKLNRLNELVIEVKSSAQDLDDLNADPAP